MVGELNKLLIVDVDTRMHSSTVYYSDVVTDAFNTKINVRNASNNIYHERADFVCSFYSLLA